VLEGNTTMKRVEGIPDPQEVTPLLMLTDISDEDRRELPKTEIMVFSLDVGYKVGTVNYTPATHRLHWCPVHYTRKGPLFIAELESPGIVIDSHRVACILEEMPEINSTSRWDAEKFVWRYSQSRESWPRRLGNSLHIGYPARFASERGIPLKTLDAIFDLRPADMNGTPITSGPVGIVVPDNGVSYEEAKRILEGRHAKNE